MYVYRFMSLKEFNKMLAGCEMKHCKNSFKAHTESKGFCFLAERTRTPYGAILPQDCLRFLSGIVTTDVLVKFKCDKKVLKKSSGSYIDPSSYDGYGYGYMDVTEYCTSNYSREIFSPIAYAIFDKWLDSCDWFKIN